MNLSFLLKVRQQAANFENMPQLSLASGSLFTRSEIIHQNFPHRLSHD